MATFANPYESDPDKAEVFELGYVSGLQDPDQLNPFRPYSPELLDVFTEGVSAGQNDAVEFASRSEARESGWWELLEHVTVEVVAHGAVHLFKNVALGLAGVVIGVLGIEGDTPLHPLDPDFSEQYQGPEDNVFYAAVCPRSDHEQGSDGVTSDGYWAASGRSDLREAVTDAVAHEHSETLVARCSLTDNTCGPVWIRKAEQSNP